ncbi:hypothetical protein BSL78_10443 [Apostichopus japonicus]|uniref:Lysosome-associated membrane glycoprotein 1 n=1 Tax=Stichopus japonicus TaxID=307972 RepID=A0A2G8KXD3_STIJA|nr:hypothetical protein BSL78_10443 [Apostichopus japonicus]
MSILFSCLVRFAKAATTAANTATMTTAGPTITGTNEKMTTNAMTTEDKMTTRMVQTTATPEPNLPTFIYQTVDGEVCMIISINAIISLETQKGDKIQSDIPETASIVKGPEECPKDLETAYIELLWNVEEHDWTLGLSFEAMENDYTLVLVNGSYSEDTDNGTTLINEWEDKDFEFASAPLGNSLHCKDVHLDYIHFVEYKFQPFAQRNDGKFGKVVECSSEEEGLSTMWIIIISVCGGAVLLFALVAIMCCCKSKRDSYQSV